MKKETRHQIIEHARFMSRLRLEPSDLKIDAASVFFAANLSQGGRVKKRKKEEKKGIPKKICTTELELIKLTVSGFRRLIASPLQMCGKIKHFQIIFFGEPIVVADSSN